LNVFAVGIESNLLSEEKLQQIISSNKIAFALSDINPVAFDLWFLTFLWPLAFDLEPSFDP